MLQMNKPANPPPWPYGWIAFGAAVETALAIIAAFCGPEARLFGGLPGNEDGAW